MDSLQKLGYFLLFLGVLVFVHELGHFLVAKLLNVKVLRFSIGFGPRIFGFTRGETEYRVAWVPLGGYVKMAGDQPYEELPPEDAKRGFLAQAPWKRALIVLAGPAFNLIFPILVYFFVFLGTQQAISTRIGSVEPGMPAAAASLEPGDKILKVDGREVTTFEELRNALRHTYERETVLTVEREGQVFEARLTPSKSVDSMPGEKSNRGMIGISPYASAPLLGVPPGSVAEASGLKTFDRILAINGKAVADEVEFQRALSQATGVLEVKVARLHALDVPGAAAQVPEVVTLSVERQPGDLYAALGAESYALYIPSVVPGSPIDLAGIKPGDRILKLDGQTLPPSWALLQVALSHRTDRTFELTWRSGSEEKTAPLAYAQLETRNIIGQKQTLPALGYGTRVPLADTSDPELMSIERGPGEALAAAVKKTGDDIALTASMFGKLVTGDLPKENIGSIGTIFKVASKSAEWGIEYFVQAMAMFSISLGLINLVPIPILDGFHLVTVFWEVVRRRPIPVRAREIANVLGLVVLLALMVFALSNDYRSW